MILPPPAAAPPGRSWAVVAVVLPLVLSIGFVWVLTRPVAPGTLPCPATEALDERLSHRDGWEVVVLGNSTANKAVQNAVLAETIGVPGRVVKATLPSSSPVTWYAALKHRVFARGHRPELVIVAAPPQTFWQERPVASLDVREMLELAGTTDPVIQRHLGTEGVRGPLHTMDLRRQSLRAAVVGSLSRAALGTVPSVAREAALDLFVIGVDRRTPLFGPVETGATAQGAELASDLSRTILPDLLELVHGYGGEVVFAATPSLVGSSDAEEDGREERLQAWAEERGSAYFRFRRLQLTEEDFNDNWHLTPAASARYTEALGRAAAAWRTGHRRRGAGRHPEAGENPRADPAGTE